MKSRGYFAAEYVDIVARFELIEGTTYEQRMIEIKEAIQSSISYAGGEDLSAFETLDFGRVM